MQAVIFVGVQATGKSTFYKERFFTTQIRINLDMLKTRHRESILLTACLQGKQNFVVDNTNSTVEDRKRYILPAREAKFEVVGYYFQSKLSELLARNQERTGTQRIPAAGIMAAYHKLQVPKLEEGFDKLFYVRIDPPDSFIVEEWQNEV